MSFTSDTKVFGPTEEETYPAPGFTVTSVEGLHFCARGITPDDDRAPHAVVYVHDAVGIEAVGHVDIDGTPSINLQVKGTVRTSISIFGISLTDLRDAVEAAIAEEARS